MSPCMYCHPELFTSFPAVFMCSCRKPCGDTGCVRLTSVLAGDAQPGMCVRSDRTSETVVVASVTEPDTEGMAWIKPVGGELWRVCQDWPLAYATKELADLEEAVLFEAGQ